MIETYYVIEYAEKNSYVKDFQSKSLFPKVNCTVGDPFYAERLNKEDAVALENYFREKNVYAKAIKIKLTYEVVD